MRIPYWIIWTVCIGICFRFSSATAHPSWQQAEQIRRLMTAADQGDTATAKALMAKGISVNARDEKGATALLHAATAGRTQMVRFLVARGAAINVVDSSNYTPLLAALWKGDHASALLLLAKGADIHVHDMGGFTPLFLAAMNGDIVIARKLIARGLKVNEQIDYRTVLQFALDKPAMLNFLLTQGADPNAIIDDYNEDSVFIAAVRSRLLDAARLMLKYGADVNQEGRYDRRALDFAVNNHDKPMIALLKRHRVIHGSRIF